MITLRKEVFENLIEILNKYRYCILRNYEQLPDVGNDIDIIIDEKSIPDIIKDLCEEMYEVSIVPVDIRSCSWVYSLYFYDEINITFIHIDLFPSLSWRGLEYLGADDILKSRIRYKSFFIPSPEEEFLDLFVTNLIYNGKIKEKYKERIIGLYAKNKDKIKARLEGFYGYNFSKFIMNCIENKNWEAINKNCFKLRFLVLCYNFRRKDFIAVITNIYKNIKRIANRYSSKRGLFVAFMGPDGSGKSTVIKGIVDRLKTLYPEKLIEFHWRPYIRPRKKNTTTIQDPHKKPPYGFFLSLIKLMIYIISYNFGYIFQILPHRLKNGPIIFDRYYQDIFVDPLRYRYGGPYRAAKFAEKFIPRPDIYIFLDVEPALLQTRKQELPEKEIKRQRLAYLKLSGNLSGAFLLDSSQSPEQVLEQASHILISLLNNRVIKFCNRFIWNKKDTLKYLTNALCSNSEISSFVFSRSADIKMEQSKCITSFKGIFIKDGRSYLLPANSGLLASAGLNLYNVQSLKAHVCREVISNTLKAGIAHIILPEVQMIVQKENIENKYGNILFLEHIKEIMQYRELYFSISSGTPGRHRKLVIQIMSPGGKIMGYVKKGWNETTDILIKNETYILKIFSSAIKSFYIPEILYAHIWNGHYFCIQSAPSGKIKGAGQKLNYDYIEVLKELADYRTINLRLKESLFYENFNKKMNKIKNKYYFCLLKRSLTIAEEKIGTEKLPFHFSHGDFAPWNAKIVKEKLWLFDWEYADTERLPAWDIFHFTIQVMGLLGKNSPLEVSKTIEKDEFILIYFRTLNIHKELLKPLFLCYLSDRLSFYITEDPLNYNSISYLSQLLSLLTLSQEEESCLPN